MHTDIKQLYMYLLARNTIFSDDDIGYRIEIRCMLHEINLTLALSLPEVSMVSVMLTKYRIHKDEV